MDPVATLARRMQRTPGLAREVLYDVVGAME